MKFRMGNAYDDCTSTYFIYLERKYTIDEFINTVLKKRSNEWGNIIIDKKKIASYSHGKLDNEIPSEILFKVIGSVDGHGGYSRMDYRIRT